MGQRYGLEVRACAVADAAGLSGLFAEVGLDVAPGDLALRIEAAQARGHVFVAIEWGPPSGVVAVQPIHALDAARPAGLIATLLVGPDARRRGIGRILLKAAARAARQAGCDRLLLPGGGPPDLAAFAAATGFVADGGGLVRPLVRRGGAEA